MKKSKDTSVISKKNHANTYPYFALLLLLITIFTILQFFSTAHSASIRQNTLILGDNYNNHYLSPYMQETLDPLNKFTADNITYKHLNERKINSESGSLLQYDISESVIWLSLDVVNRSSNNYWNLDFGNSFIGRFGLLKDISVYIADAKGNNIRPIKTDSKNIAPLYLPTEKKSLVILKLEKEIGVPVTIPLQIINSSSYQLIKSRQAITNFVIMIGLTGIIFLLGGIFIVYPSKTNIFLSLYYFTIIAFLLIQNNFIAIDMPILKGHMFPIILILVSISAFITSHSFWNLDNEERAINIFTTGLILAAAANIFAILAINFLPPLPQAGLYFGINFIILATIVFFSYLQTQQGNIDRPYYTIAWVSFLVGAIITNMALTGSLPAAPFTVNAYLYALIPQAFFLILAIKAKIDMDDSDITLSKSVNIKDNHNVTRLRQTKENSEQERLLKVIEQERKVLGELRKSEARRTEEMRIAKEEADDANRAKSAFLAVVSHEIRTPMTGVMGMVKLLMNTKLNKEQKDCALTIQDSSEAMLALLNDILDFEKIERGLMEFEHINMDLPRIVLGVSTLMKGHAVQKGIELRTKIGSTLPQYVKGDPTRLRQVLLNLTGNSIKFTQQGHVTLTAELIKEETTPEGGQTCEIYFGISDTGIGISKEAQKTLFDAFSQANSGIARQFGGSGLGLAISQGLIEGMGSEINLNSNEGEGSTFFFTLNLEIGSGNIITDETHSYTPAQINNVPSLSILIVDDNMINRQVIMGFLKSTPHTLDVAESAEEALKKIVENNYTTILMDVELPGMNGDEATKQIRNSDNPDIAALPVVAITGNTMPTEIKRFYDAGMTEVLAKPIDPEKLISVLTKIAQNKHENTPQIIKKTPEASSFIKPASATPIDTTKTPDTPVISKPVPKVQKTDDGLEEKTGENVSVSGAIIKTKKNPEVEQDDEQTPMAAYLSAKKEAGAPKQEAKTVEKPKKKKLIQDSEVEVKKNAQDDTIVSPPKTVVQAEEHLTFKQETINTLKQHLGLNELQEMLDETIIKSEEIIEQLTTAYETQDITGTIARAHELKGMTGNFGLMELSHQAAQIETALKSDKTDNLESLINDLPKMQKRAKKALNQWLSE